MKPCRSRNGANNRSALPSRSLGEGWSTFAPLINPVFVGQSSRRVANFFSALRRIVQILLATTHPTINPADMAKWQTQRT